MAYLGLILGDKFETDKGTFVVTGIKFSQGERTGIIFKPYVSYDDDRTPGNYLSDDVLKIYYNKIKYRGNEK